MKRVLFALIPLFTAIGILLVWQIAAWAIGSSLILPAPWEVVRSLFSLWKDGAFWAALGRTLLRAFEAFAFSFFVALACAFAGRNAALKRVFDCLFGFVRAIPTMSVLLLLLLWLSPSGAPQAVAAIVVCPTLYSAFSAAVGAIDPALEEMCALYRVRKRDVLFKFRLPSIAEGLFEGAASGLSLNLKLVVSAEAIAQAAKSLGTMMQTAKLWLEVERLLALTLVAIALGMFGEWAIRRIGRRVLRWKQSS